MNLPQKRDSVLSFLSPSYASKHLTSSEMRLSSCLIIGSVASTALSWGSLGHRTVAYLASLYLTPEATKFTNQLLNGQDISEAALVS